MAKSGNGKRDDLPENERPKDEQVDVAAEFAEVGRKMREAIETAWNSQERRKLQEDIREGLNRLANEVGEAGKNLRDSEVGQRVETSTKQTKDDFESGKIAEDMRRGLVKALRGLSDALDHMASSFTPTEDEGAAKDAPKK